MDFYQDGDNSHDKIAKKEKYWLLYPIALNHQKVQILKVRDAKEVQIMALVICLECKDAKISDSALQCPKCGCGMEKILKMMAENERKFQAEKNITEQLLTERAELEWDCYINAIAEAADRYNAEYTRVEAKYALLIKNFGDTAKAVNERVRGKLIQIYIKEVDKKGKFIKFKTNAEIERLIKEIDADKTKFYKALNQIENKINNEIEPLAKELKEKQALQIEKIESEIKDLNVRLCTSAIDVLKQLVSKKDFIGSEVRKMLDIKGPMTRKEIIEALPFSNFRDQEIVAEVKRTAEDILGNQESLGSYGINEKKLVDDFYLMSITESERYKGMLELMNFYNERNTNLHYRLNNYEDKDREKSASVIKRGIVGTLIAGPAGAVIGVASALDKNISNKNKSV